MDIHISTGFMDGYLLLSGLLVVLLVGAAVWPEIRSKAVATAKWRPSEVFLLLSCVISAMLVSALDGTMFNTALPTIAGEFHGVGDMQWVGTIYLWASAVMLPIYGKLGDIVDRKKLFMGAMGIFLAGSVIGALSQSMVMVIVGRGIQGIGGGGLMTLAFTILAMRFSPRERTAYTGYIMGTFGIVSLIGPFIGGLFTDAHHIFGLTTSWRWAFWLNIPLGLLAIALAWKCLPRQAVLAKRSKTDMWGIVLLTLISSLLVLASSWGGVKYAWGSPTILLLVAGAVVAIAALVWIELRVERQGGSPFLPMSLFNMRKYRDFALVTVAGVALGIAMFGVIGYIPTYIQIVTGYSASMSGVLTLPMMVLMLVVSIGLGKIIRDVDGFKYRRVPLVGVLIMAGAIWMLGTMTPTTPVWLMCVYLGVMGLGLGLSMQLLPVIAQNTFPLSMTGTVTGVNQYFRQIGSTFGMSGVGALFVSFLATQLHLNLGISLSGGGGGATLTPAAVQAMPPAMKTAVIASYSESLTSVFHIMVWIVVAAGILMVFLTGAPLRKENQDDAIIEAMDIEGPSLGALLTDEPVLVPASRPRMELHEFRRRDESKAYVEGEGRHRADDGLAV